MPPNGDARLTNGIVYNDDITNKVHFQYLKRKKYILLIDSYRYRIQLIFYLHIAWHSSYNRNVNTIHI